MAVGEGLDPIRIQKSLFLVAQESGAPALEAYKFVPYNWGPFSREIYEDLERLQADGLLERVHVPGKSYYSYRQTSTGHEQARRIETLAAAPLRAKIRELRTAVATDSFDQLLRRVYDRYPDFAANSIFQK